MTQEEQVKKVAEEVVNTVLTRLGIDCNDPLQAQRDFQSVRIVRALLEDPEFQLDFAHVRRWRLTTEKMADVGVRTLVKILVTFTLGLLALGTKDWWIKHITG